MEIVISVPESWEKCNNTFLRNCIRNGKVLPKGHGRLIDERLLREDMERAYKYANELAALGFAESFLEHAQTIVEADKEGADNGTD